MRAIIHNQFLYLAKAHAMVCDQNDSGIVIYAVLPKIVKPLSQPQHGSHVCMVVTHLLRRLHPKRFSIDGKPILMGGIIFRVVYRI